MQSIIQPISISQLESQILINAFRQSPEARHQQLADRLQKCGPFDVINENTGEVMKSSYYCGLKVCPRCQRKRQRRNIRESRTWITPLIRNHEYKYIYVSIGFPNVHVDDVRLSQKNIGKGFRQLIHGSKKWPGRGMITTHEFTIDDDGLIHLNTHSIIAVDPSSLTNGYNLEFQEWRELIKGTFKLQYLDSVHVQLVRGSTRAQIIDNFIYTLNYSLKPQDFASYPSVSVQLADQLHATRRFTVTGLFREIKQSLKPKKSKSVFATGCSSPTNQLSD